MSVLLLLQGIPLSPMPSLPASRHDTRISVGQVTLDLGDSQDIEAPPEATLSPLTKVSQSL